MSGKLLFLGDVHLGRRPVTLPQDEDPGRYGPDRAWSRTVTLALRERVAAVLFAGDVVESLQDRFEAERLLRPGIEELLAEGIRVLAVVGNHDVFALPRLARVLPGFEIIGQDGWESIVLEHEGRPLCRVQGWSFSDPVCRESPLESLSDDSIIPDLPNIGLLHCDRDAAGSRHAPVRSSEFSSGPAGHMDAWFLGHVHKPDYQGLGAERPVGYLGSLVGLDPGEPGCHGPWLVTISGKILSTRQIPVGPIRYEERSLDLDGLEYASPEDLEDALRDRIHAAFVTVAAQLADDLVNVEACGMRFRSTGRVEHPAEVMACARRMIRSGETFQRDMEGCLFFCEKILGDLRPRLALDELARGSGPQAALARYVLDLDHGEVDTRGLAGTIEEFLGRPTWSDLEAVVDPLGATRLKEAALDLLGAMQLQREDRG